MPVQTGRSIITGDIDVPLADDTYTALYDLKAIVIQRSITADVIDAAGRGDGDAPETRPGAIGGVVKLSGKANLSHAQYPTIPAGVLCLLTLHYDTGKSEELIVRVTAHSINETKKENDVSWTSITCVIVAVPTQTGWSPPTPPTESFADPKELWRGIEKVYDENNILMGAKQAYLLWGVEDDDESEVERIIEEIDDAVDPIGVLKLRPPVFTRHPKQVLASYLNLQWAMQDTADDVTQPLMLVVHDPFEFASREITVALNGTPPNAVNTNLRSRTITDQILNDYVTRSIRESGPRDTAEDHYLPHVYKVLDEAGLAAAVSVAYPWVNTGGAPDDAIAVTVLTNYGFTVPDDMKIIARRDEAVDHNNNLTIWVYDYRDSLEKSEADGHFITVDPEGIEIGGRSAKVFVTDSENPSAPDDQADYTAIDLVVSKYTDVPTSNPAYTRRVFEEEPYNTRDKRIARSSASFDLSESMPDGVVTEEVQVEDCSESDSLPDLLEAKVSDLLSDATVIKIIVDKVETPLRANFRIIRRTDDYAVVEEAMGSFQKLSMTDGSGALVFVSDYITLDSGTLVTLIERRVQVVRKRIHIVRLRLTDEVNDFRDLAATGKVNNGAFLDFDALTLLYEGTSARYNWGMEGSSRPVAFVSTFLYETYDGYPGHFWVDAPANFTILTSATISSRGATSGAGIDASFAPQGPGTADMSGILS